MKKKVVIIGAGVGGMSAGIYLLDNGFDVTIYEKHSIPGGECTGWSREGVHIDGSAHWIVGTNPNSDLYALWKHVGVLDKNTKIYRTDYFDKFKYGDEVVTMYADLRRLEPELIRIAPEDEKQIKKMIRSIEAYQKVRIPVTKPVDMMNIFELINFGIGMLGLALVMHHYKKQSAKDYSEYFKNPMLKRLIADLLDEDYNIHSFLYVMQALSLNNAGVIEGQSIGIAMKMKKTFEEKGGILKCSCPVSKINVVNGVAKSVILENNEVVEADYIVGATDAHHLFYDLLDNQYTEKYFTERFGDSKRFPLNSSIMASFKVAKDCKDLPKMLNVVCKPFNLGEKLIDRVSIRNYSFIRVEKDGSCCMSVLAPAGNSLYDQLRLMTPEQYKNFKENIGEILREAIKKAYKFNDEDIKLIDMTTPLTYERYTNAYKGSYMSFLDTKFSKGLMRKGSVKGIKNFVMASQWIMPPGGLPIALFAGKHAAYRITKWNKQKFIDTDNPNWGLINKALQFTKTIFIKNSKSSN